MLVGVVVAEHGDGVARDADALVVADALDEERDHVDRVVPVLAAIARQ
jgi:hypothetical protein